MTYLFVIVGAIVFFFLYWRWTKRRLDRDERTESFKGKVALCPALVTRDDAPMQNVCLANVADVGTWKRSRPIKGGDEFVCAACGTKQVWNMLLVPKIISYDKPREPRRRRRGFV